MSFCLAVSNVNRGGRPPLANVDSSSLVEAQSIPIRKRRCIILARLRKALACVTREERSEALQKLPQSVRKALLTFMERSEVARRSKVIAKRARNHIRPSHSVNAKVQQTKRSRRFFLGVSHKGTGYLAQIRIIPYLHVVTQCTASYQEARAFYEALAAARACLMAQDQQEISGALVQDTIAIACAKLNMQPSLPRLSYCAAVDAHAIVGCTINTTYTTDLQASLDHRRALLRARNQGWPQLRSAWIQALQSSFQARSRRPGCSLPCTRSRMSSKEACRIADAARARHLRRQETLSRRQEEQARRRLQLAANAAILAVDEAEVLSIGSWHELKQ